MKKAFRWKSLSFMTILFLTLGLQNTFGQGVGISEDPITPHESAILELRSEQRGFLIPRMDQGQRDAINGGSPATGLIIYNTTTNKLNIYDGSVWRVLFSGDVGINDIFGTANRIDITKTDPANPVIDIDVNYAGQTSITTLGTITTGTWNADILDVQYGGTGLTTFGGTNTVLYTSTADNLEAVPTSTADGQFLQTTTAGGAPTWKTILDVSNGGTGLSSITANHLIYGNDAGAVNLLAPDGTTGTLLMNTDGGPPSWYLLSDIPETGLTPDRGVYTTTGGQLTTVIPNDGTLGFWNRTGTTLSPATNGDDITTTGDIYTTGTGTMTSAGLLTAQDGLNVTNTLQADDNVILGATNADALTVNAIATFNDAFTIADGATQTNINNDDINIGNAATDVIDISGITNLNGGSVSINTNLTLASGTSINEFSIDGTFIDNSNDAVPTEQAVKTYVDNSIDANDNLAQGNIWVGDASGNQSAVA
ncbi:hypothetical protein, partial [Vibrio sp.]|uniref:hypothetical protein n=1 Tax=Vibrio sp. TaxID=678 RepID=UPI003D0C18BB